MPIKGQSPKEVVHTEMHKFKEGTLHSGSKKGPKVKSRSQAIAIALSEAGKAKPKGAVDRSSHNPGNPGFPSAVSHSPPQESAMKSKKTEAAHESREKQVMGASYAEHHQGEAGKGHETPQSMMQPKGFNHTQLKGCFLGEHHRATDHTRTPHRFSGTKNAGPVLRVSGKAGAHMLGSRKR